MEKPLRVPIKYTNGVVIGEAILEIDGFYYFNSGYNSGLWSEASLKYILNKLESLNRDWNKFLIDNLKKGIL